MSIVELVPISDDETDAEIVRLCKDGVSVARVAKQLGLSPHDVNAALDRALPKIDGPYKRRQIALSALRLDELTEVFHHKAVTEKDVEAGNLCVRFEAERRALLGFTGSNYDPAQLLAIADPQQNSTTAYIAVLERLGKWPPSPTDGSLEVPGAESEADKSPTSEPEVPDASDCS